MLTCLYKYTQTGQQFITLAGSTCFDSFTYEKNISTIKLIFLFFFFSFALNAQGSLDDECGFGTSQEDYAQRTTEYPLVVEHTQNRQGIFDHEIIPVNFTIAQDEEGNPLPPGSIAVDQAMLDNFIAYLNTEFAPMNVIFVQCGVHYINNTKAAIVIGNEAVASTIFSFVTSALDIRIGNNDGGGIRGSASGVSSTALWKNHGHKAYLRTSNDLLGPVLPHEIGHVYRLYHTFQGARLYTSLNGYQQLAADVNRSGSVTTFDLVFMSKLVLGVIEEFPNQPGGPWRFIPEYIPANHLMAFHDNPFNMTFNGISYTNEAPYLWADWEYNIVDGTNGLAGYDAIKLGDVNGSVLNGIVENCPEYDVVEFSPPSPEQADRYVTLSINTVGFDNVIGFQFGFHFDENYLDFLGVHSSLPGFTAENIGSPSLHLDDELRISWVESELDPKSMTDGGTLLEIDVFTKVSLPDINNYFYLDNDIMSAEFYDVNGCAIPVQLEKQKIVSGRSALKNKDQFPSLSKAEPNLICYPNPSLGKINIAFRSVEETKGTIYLQTLNGKVLMNKSVDLVNGINQFSYTDESWPEPVLLVTIKTQSNIFTERIVILR